MSRASWRALILGAAGFSGAMLLLAPVRNAAVAGALLLVIGFCFSTWTANSQSILQLTAPDRLRGRVLGLYLFAFAGLSPIGGLLAGWLAEVGGTELAFAVAGVAGLAVTAYVVTRRPRPAAGSSARRRGRAGRLGSAAFDLRDAEADDVTDDVVGERLLGREADRAPGEVEALEPVANPVDDLGAVGVDAEVPLGGVEAEHGAAGDRQRGHPVARSLLGVGRDLERDLPDALERRRVGASRPAR